MHNFFHKPSKRIRGWHDTEGIYVYQAFRPAIVQVAVAKGTFGAGFTLDRMTWIKPSFGWMLHRSGYATKSRQEAIARIHLSHEGFHAILEQAVPTAFDARIFDSERAWTAALNQSDVRYQWDPDRDLRDGKNSWRAIQLGIRGDTIYRYVHEWILGIEEVTDLAHDIRDAVLRRDRVLPSVPVETEYPIPATLQQIMGYD